MDSLTRSYLIVCFFFCLNPLGIAQRDLTPAQQTEFIHAFRDGDQYLSKKKYEKALKAFERAVELKPEMAAAYRRLGVVHEVLKNYQKAADYFEKCIEINPELSRAVYFQAGEMWMKVEQYDQAKKRLKEYEEFLKLPPGTFENGELELETEAYFNTLLPSYLANCTFAAHKVDFENVDIQNLGPKINSELDDLFPYISNNETWMFYTRNVPYGEEDQLMYSTAEGQSWAKSKALLDKKMRDEFNQGMGKISRDESVMYFPGYDLDNENGDCNILKAKMYRDAIQDIDKLGPEVNSPHWESQPSINCDGNSLYFVSKRPGGYGGSDIYVCHLQENGKWTQAMNLGPTINTPMDEESPFISDDNVTLFFASNGHPGYGGMDIFYARFSEEESWSKPQNMGRPVNSSEEELSFFMTARGDKGYIASSREGGFGGFDIYKFKMPAKKDFEEIAYVKGRVLDAVTKKPVQSVVYIGDKGNYPTDKYGHFFVCHPTLSKLNVLVAERKYYDFEEAFELNNWNESGFVEIDIYLRPLNQSINIASLETKALPTASNMGSEKMAIDPVLIQGKGVPTERIYTTENVHFYFDDFRLTQEARFKIDQLIADIDHEQLALIIVEGFADHIGTDDYNQKLSEKRAEEVANYLKAKGYTNLRIKYKGYGETQSSMIYSKNRKVDIHVYYKI